MGDIALGWFKKKEEPKEEMQPSAWHEEAAYPPQQYAQPFTPPPIPTIQPLQQVQPSITSKDIEIISAKLDAIKAMLDNLNQRIANLERIARE